MGGAIGVKAKIGPSPDGRPVATVVVQEVLRVEAFERLKKIVTSLDEDMSKAMGGNKAAGTRVRQAMQDVKSAAQEIREGILTLRASDEESKAKK